MNKHLDILRNQKLNVFIVHLLSHDKLEWYLELHSTFLFLQWHRLFVLQLVAHGHPPPPQLESIMSLKTARVWPDFENPAKLFYPDAVRPN